jgi:CRP/FNR family transcriptional regulator, cyclic AMP receptor protein
VERVRQAALTIISRIGAHDSARALAHALGDSSYNVRSAAADMLVQLGNTAVPTVHPLLDSSDAQLRKMATVVLARINPREFGALVTSNMTGNLITIYRNYVSASALSSCDKYAAITILQNALREQSRQLTDELFYLLAALHSQSNVNIIVQSLHSSDPRLRANATEALESLTTPQTAQLIEPLVSPDPASEKVLAVCRDMWSMEPPQTDQLIRQYVEDATTNPWQKAIMTFALGEIGATSWAQRAQGGTGSAPVPPAKTTEAPPQRRGRRRPVDLFNALVDDSSTEEAAPRVERPRRANPLDALNEEKPADSEPSDAATTTNTMETILGNASFTAEDVRRLTQKNTALSPCESLFSLAEIETMLAKCLVDPAADVRAAAEAANRVMCGLHITDLALQEDIVLSTIEKIIFLKEVPFFQGMTIDQLKVLATVCEEEFFSADTRIFHQDDPGGALYVVISGRVGIEQEKRKGSFARLATIEPHSYFGEMNLFDNSPRSASAIALQDTLTLRLRREPLIALARQYPALSLELINVLSARLRETSDRIAELTKTRPRELHKLFDQFD